jgi:hypothetical protein
MVTHRHCTPVRVSRGGGFCQFGRASAPMIPHRVHTMRGPNVGTGTSSDPPNLAPAQAGEGPDPGEVWIGADT